MMLIQAPKMDPDPVTLAMSYNNRCTKINLKTNFESRSEILENPGLYPLPIPYLSRA